MRQFLQIKEQHPDAILFFRLGDFYEMFFEDAVIAAKALDLTLTTRNKKDADAIPMCGVPYHAGRQYVARLTEQGHKVVMCEQIGDPKKSKGLVKREVVRIITPGVVLDDDVLDPKRGRYLASVTGGADDCFGLAYLDVSTGEFRVTQVTTRDALVGELSRVQPSELLASDAELGESGALAWLVARQRHLAFSAIERVDVTSARELLDDAWLEDSGAALEAFGGSGELAICAAADVVEYARNTQPGGTLPLSRLQVYDSAQAVTLDEAAVANLELCSTLIGARREGSLLSVIDETCTAPGGRLLRRWLLYPLTSVAPIRRRQDAVEFLVERAALRAHVRELLRGIADLERLAGRVSLGVATPRDLGRLRDSIDRVPQLAAVLAGRAEPDAPAVVIDLPELLDFDASALAVLETLHGDLAAALVDEPPPITKEGGFIRVGYCAKVDEHRQLADGGKDAILAIETRERERTGIPVLRVKYNRVFGYYIEVTRAHLSRVPEDYVRKQTIANGERYVTTELAELEAKILTAQEAVIAREHELLAQLLTRVGNDVAAVVAAGQQVAVADVGAALAEVAHTRGYVRPEVDDDELLDIEGGRHPVVEKMVAAGSFVPNDCRLEPTREQIMLITGPNMAGKSTYMRQVAHIVLLAQVGSFVPATRAHVGLVDRIFTRVGASDNLAQGESTFMVEMRETAAILSGATRRSLVVLDEVGRGTSTFDGVSIAWAVTEFLHDAIGARTLFATHYHELCALAETRPRVTNTSVAVREHKGEIVFLRRVVAGGASRSYGIDVARLAGLPRSVVSRARQILAELERARQLGEGAQLGLFAAASLPEVASRGAAISPAAEDILAELGAQDVNQMTPLEALNLVARLHGALATPA